MQALMTGRIMGQGLRWCHLTLKLPLQPSEGVFTNGASSVARQTSPQTAII